MAQRLQMLMVQPGRTGDILITLPIAKFYQTRGYSIIWPMPLKYRSIMRNISYVTPCYYDMGEDTILPIIYTSMCGYDSVCDLSFGFHHTKAGHLWRPNSAESFITVKYRTAGVPIEYRWNLEWDRDEEKENELYSKVVTGTPYTFIHDETWSGRYEVPGASHDQKVYAHEIEGYSIFDWRRILVEAAEIVAIDSSFANLIDVLPECRDIPKSVSMKDSVAVNLYKNNWKVIPDGRLVRDPNV